MDATRIADGVVVTLKSVKKSSYAQEVEIATLFGEEPLKSDPRNHCVRILDVLQDPNDEGTSIIVMPFLKRYFEPRFDTVGEAVEFFHQTLEVRTRQRVWWLGREMTQTSRAWSSSTSSASHTGETYQYIYQWGHL